MRDGDFKATSTRDNSHYQECLGSKERPEDIGIPAEDIVTTDPSTGAYRHISLW